MGVLGIDLGCICGLGRQTLQHILTFCPSLTQARANLIIEIGSIDLRVLLTDTKKLRAAARWLLATNLLEQFQVAIEIEKENLRDWAPF